MDPKLRITVDKSHGKDHVYYQKLVQFLSNRCQATILDKKPLNLKQLSDNSVLVLITPNKYWEEAEIETVHNYVEGHSGILLLMVHKGLNREHVNRLLKPFGLAVTEDKVDDKNMERHSFSDSPFLKGVDRLAAGKVYGYPSTGIATSRQAEVVLKYKGVIMGTKVSPAKGTVYLFSCLPVLGDKQLKQDGNTRFFDNLLESLEMLAAQKPVRPMTEEEAQAAGISTEEVPAEHRIVGSIVTGHSEDLFFDLTRVIIAKKGSIAKFLGGGFLAAIAEGVYEGIKEGIKDESQLSSDKILQGNKNNFSLAYDRIKRLEIRKRAFPFGAWMITIETDSLGKHSYDWSLGAGRDVKQHTDFLIPLLGDKLSINGRNQEEEEESGKSIADYNKAIELAPDSADAYYNRGDAYDEMGEYAKAIADYNKAIELDPYHALAYYNRGCAYGELSAYDKAIADYNKAIDLNSNDALAYYNRGLAYRERGEMPKAVSDLENSIGLSTDSELIKDAQQSLHEIKNSPEKG